MSEYEFHTVGEFVGGPYDGMQICFNTSRGWTEPPGTIAVDQGCDRLEIAGTAFSFHPFYYSERFRYTRGDWFVDIDGELHDFFNLVHTDKDALENATMIDGRILVQGRYDWGPVE